MKTKESRNRAGMIMLAHHLKVEEKMNEKSVAYRRVGWWIIAALCGLLTAFAVVGPAKAHDDQNWHDRQGWYHSDLTWYEEGNFCFFDPAAEQLGPGAWLCYNPTPQQQHYWAKCVGMTKDAFPEPKWLPEIKREYQWIMTKAKSKGDGSNKERVEAMDMYMDYRCAIREIWKLLAKGVEAAR